MINGLFRDDQLPGDTPDQVKRLIRKAGVGKLDENKFGYVTMFCTTSRVLRAMAHTKDYGDIGRFFYSCTQEIG